MLTVKGGTPAATTDSAKRGAHAVHDRRRLGDVASHGDQKELLSTESGDHVARPYPCAAHRREVTERAIAGGVPVRVIEDLEVARSAKATA
jgi:hypothetical protein